MASFADIFGKSTTRATELEVEDVDFASHFPLLFMLLSKVKDDAGKPRQGATITILCEGGVVKAGVRDRDHAVSLWVSSESLGGVFTALEEAIGAKPPQWRKSPENWGRGGTGQGKQR